MSVALTPGVVDRVEEGTLSLRPVSHRGGRQGETAGMMGVFGNHLPMVLWLSGLGGRKRKVRCAASFSLVKGEE